MAAASWKANLKKGDKRVSGAWNQVWNGNKWVSTRKTTPASSGSSAPSTTPAASGNERFDPLYGENFLSPGRREKLAQEFVDKTTTPDSEIVAAGQRALTGAENIGAGYTASQKSLQEGLGNALSAIAGSTQGMAGSNLYAGLNQAQALQNATPGIQGSALVAGTAGDINATTRSLQQKNADARRTALANRLNELYKRDVDKSSAREQSALTRETLGTKESIAAADNALAAQKFNIQTDISYKRLAQAQQRIDQSGSSSPQKLLKEAGSTIKSLLKATAKTQDQTMGHLVVVRDPVTMASTRKWYPGGWEAVMSQAQAEYGPELQDTDVSPQGGLTVNPSGTSVTKPKYSKAQVRKTMIQWVINNVPGYNRATATAWVDSQPEMKLAS
jgi:hypothetical protein